MIIKTTPIKQVKNEKDWPSEYTCNFLEAGLVSYQDSGAGIAMLRKETILKMIPTFIGKPVVIDHIDVTPKDFKDHAVGYITKVWFDDYMGWAMCSFILTDDKAKEKVAKGYSVSCAYDVLSTSKGGEWHAIKYDEEITDGSGTHLALVTSPRYESAKIQPCTMLVNSKKAVMKEGEGKKENGPQPDELQKKIDLIKEKIKKAIADSDDVLKEKLEKELDVILEKRWKKNEVKTNINIEEFVSNNPKFKEFVRKVYKTEWHVLSDTILQEAIEEYRKSEKKNAKIGDSVTIDYNDEDSGAEGEDLRGKKGKIVGIKGDLYEIKYGSTVIQLKSSDFKINKNSEGKNNATTADLMRIVQEEKEGHEEAAKELIKRGVLLPDLYSKKYVKNKNIVTVKLVNSSFKVGDRVRWKNPNVDEGEAGHLMQVLEIRGDRLLVKHVGTGMKIEPTTNVKASEVEKAPGQNSFQNKKLGIVNKEKKNDRGQEIKEFLDQLPANMQREKMIQALMYETNFPRKMAEETIDRYLKEDVRNANMSKNKKNYTPAEYNPNVGKISSEVYAKIRGTEEAKKWIWDPEEQLYVRKDKKNTNKKEDTKMVQLYKKANQKAGAEVDPNDPTKQKWNAESVFVQIENEYVPLTELAKHAKQNEFEPIESVENEIEINGAKHNIADLVANYKASKSSKNEDKEEEKKENKDKEEMEEKEEEKKENEDKEEEKENADDKEDKSKAEQEKEEERIKENEEKEKKEDKKNAKKDLQHFVKLNTLRENGMDQVGLTIDTQHSRVERGVNRYGSGK